MKNPNFYTLGQAAKASAVSKATISKALKTGRISYIEKTSAGYKIDPAEVHRVYPRTVEGNGVPERSETPLNTATNSVLEAELKAERAMRSRLESEIEDLKVQRDEWMGQAKQLALPHPDSDRAGRRLFGLWPARS